MQERARNQENQSPEDQLAVFNQTFANFNSTIRQLNESYAALQSRYQKLSDELTATNQKLIEALDQNIQTRNFVQNVLESLTAGVITLDLDGRISSVNKAACEILRASAQEITGQDYRSVFNSTLMGKYSPLDLLNGKNPFRMVEKSVRISESDEIPIAASASCIKDSNEQTVGVLEIFEDLSGIKRLEDEIARVRSLAALGEVAAVVAHEVRNPLSGIAGFAALLRSELGEDHPNIAYVNKIISGVEKLNRSVTSLLEYARDLRHEPRPTELNAFLKETVEFFRVDLHSRASKSQVKLDMPRQPITCSFDKENLSGALINLLKNADESMPKGGTISVELRDIKGSTVINVSDQGSGISDDLKDKIFTPFFTTRDGGTGLGLALVRKVVEAHRGQIEVFNNSDRGATFSIKIPQR